MTARLLIGTYTERLPHVDGKADGLLGATFADGRLEPAELLAAVRNPSFVAASPGGDRVYAVIETDELDGEEGGGLAAFRRDGSGALEPLGVLGTGGGCPCHVAVDRRGRFAFVSNYTGGSVSVFRLAGDGALAARTDLVRHVGAGPHPARQEAPHAHMVAFLPGCDGELLVSDLGTDRLVRYRLREDGTLEERPEATVATPPGFGPRHVAFHPDGRHAYAIGELACEVLVLRREGDRLEPVAVAPTVSGEARDGSTAGAIRVSASGRSLLVTNRGPHSDDVALLAVGSDGGLELRGSAPAGGRTPRDLAELPGGRVLVANQDGDTVGVLALDEDAGTLELLDAVPVPSPVSLLVVG